MSEPKGREYFRLVYPSREYVTVEVGRSRYRLVDVSEKGFKFEPGPELGRYPPGTQFDAALALEPSSPFTCKATVVRIENDGVAVTIDRPIPMAMILKEQRRLISGAPPRRPTTRF